MKIRHLSNFYRTLLDPIKSILTVTHRITFENKNTSSFRNDYVCFIGSDRRTVSNNKG